MLDRLALAFVLLAWTSLPLVPAAYAEPSCQFVFGFATLQALLPNLVGSCLDDEQHNGSSGDAIQHTTGGLLAWRKLDNWTAFTDGYHTWINGPSGLVERLNSQRFAWEANPDRLPVASARATDDAARPGQGTYHICGADPQIEQAIARLIGDHTFSATLVSGAGGCADLIIEVSPSASSADQRTSTSLAVDHLSVQIVTEKGATDVTIQSS